MDAIGYCLVLAISPANFEINFYEDYSIQKILSFCIYYRPITGQLII